MSVNIGSAFLTLVPKMGSTAGIGKEIDAASGTMGGRFNKAFKGAAIGAAALTAAAGLAGAAVKKAMDSTAAYGDQVDKASQKMGISAQGYQQWSYVMERNGASIDNLKVGMKTLTAQMESGSAAFDTLGVATKNADGSFRDAESVMNDSITALAGVEDATQRTALANDLFGKRTAQELAPMLNSGADSIEELKNRAEELGMVMSDKAVKASADYQDAMTDLSGSMTGLKNNMMGSLLPAATQLASGISDEVGAMSVAIYQADGDFGKVADAIGSHLGNIVGVIAQRLPEVVSMAGQLISSLVTGIAKSLPTVIPNLVAALVGTLPALIQGVTSVITGLAQALPQAIPPLIAAIPTVVMALVDALVTCIPALITGAIQMVLGIVNNLPRIINQLVAKMPYIVTQLVNALVKCIPQLVKAGFQLFVALVKNMPQIISTIVATLPSLISSIVSNIGSAVSQFISAGENLVVGLWNGFTSKFKNWLMSKVSGLINLLPGVVKKALGIHSPSRVFAELGEYSAEGFNQGFERRWTRNLDGINGMMDFASATGSAGGGAIVINGMNVHAEDVLTLDRFVDMLRGANMQYA